MTEVDKELICKLNENYGYINTSTPLIPPGMRDGLCASAKSGEFPRGHAVYNDGKVNCEIVSRGRKFILEIVYDFDD